MSTCFKKDSRKSILKTLAVGNLEGDSLLTEFTFKEIREMDDWISMVKSASGFMRHKGRAAQDASGPLERRKLQETSNLPLLLLPLVST